VATTTPGCSMWTAASRRICQSIVPGHIGEV
jgi:hypothetical protein